ncbi:MAG TPA: TRCF domain-containing protein, partial [Aquaticitalea sp.]|nr:TRCF domain-containing protein [Aquaticitalea sp.]
DQLNKEYVKDITIDSDFELLFPDDYVNNITERLNLYTKLNEIKTEEGLQKFESNLIDRFGELPRPVVDLLNSVRVKWIATKIGLEKVVMKHGKLVGYFIHDQQSAFYQSHGFTKVLQYIQQHPNAGKIKEKQTRTGLRLLITFEHIKTVKQALAVLQPILE